MTTESDPAFVAKPAPPGYRYAGAWIRLGALIIDGLLLGVALFAVFMVVGLAIAATGDTLMSLETEGWPAGAVVYVLTSIVMLGWYGGWQSRVGGTPGMLLLKLRVLDPGGRKSPPSARPWSATRPRFSRTSARSRGVPSLTARSGSSVWWSISRSGSPSPRARRAKASTTGSPTEHSWCARRRRCRHRRPPPE